MIGKYLEGGPERLGTQLGNFNNNKVILEAIANVRNYFDSPKGLGPTSVPDFLGETDPESREILQRDAFEVMQAVLSEFQRASGTAAAAAARDAESKKER